MRNFFALLLALCSTQAFALPVSSGGNYGSGTTGGSTLIVGTRNDSGLSTLATTNLGTGPVAIDQNGRIFVTGNLTASAAAELATATDTASVTGASLFKLVAGRDANSVVRALTLTPTGRLKVDATDSTQPVTTVGKTPVDHIRYDYSGTSVVTGAYTQLKAAVAGACSELEIFDSSGQTLVLATGAAASEVDQIYVLPGGNGSIRMGVASGTRLSVKAVSGPASVGEISINCYQ